MKYTKYSYQRNRNSNNSFGPIIIITILSICIGLGLAWILYNQFFPSDGSGGFIQTNNKPVVNDSNTTTTEESNGEVDYIFIQCGYFAKKENADASFQQVDDEFLSFMVEDSEKYRVSAGIYPLKEGTDKMESLKSSGLEVSKMSFLIPDDNNIDKQVAAIIDGYLKVINKLGEADVKSVNTKELKDYVQGLEVIESGDRIEVLNNLKEHIKGLAEDMTKDDVKKEMVFIFQILINYKQ